MKKMQQPRVVNVTTKKKYVKPDFEVINLEDTPKLLAASGGSITPDGTAGYGTGSTFNNKTWGNN